MTDWADEKAREWLDHSSVWDRDPDESHYASLAALLREVEREVADRIFFKGAAVVWDEECNRIRNRAVVELNPSKIHDEAWDLGRREMLAEVRRVVEECGEVNADWENCATEILARLEEPA